MQDFFFAFSHFGALHSLIGRAAALLELISCKLIF